MDQSEPSVLSSLQTAHPGYLTVREICAQIRDCEFTPAVAVAREELRLRGRSLEPGAERSETARFSNCDDEHGDNDVSRIPTASSAQELWAQHKYSVLARDHEAYEKIGRRLAKEDALDRTSPRTLVEELEAFLRQPPEESRLTNAVQHLWGYVNEEPAPAEPGDPSDGRDATPEGSVATPDWDDPLASLRRIGDLARAQNRTYLLHSTALSDLSGWLVFLSDRA